MIIPKEVRQKPAEYLFLAAVFLIGIILYFFVAHDPHSKRIIVYLMAANYFFWSLYHHYKRGDLNLQIIIEYLIFALLGIFLLTLSFF